MVSKWWHEYQDVVEVVVVDDASVAKMSSGDVDVEPYLDSRNTKGYGEPQLKVSKTKMCQKRRMWIADKLWGWYTEVVVV